MANPTWGDVYGGPIPVDLPAAPRKVTPYVQAPACPGDCTGRHELEGNIRCESCEAVAYQEWRHEYRVNPGVYFHVLVPVNGADPLVDAHMPCPLCGGQFRK